MRRGNGEERRETAETASRALLPAAVLTLALPPAPQTHCYRLVYCHLVCRRLSSQRTMEAAIAGLTASERRQGALLEQAGQLLDALVLPGPAGQLKGAACADSDAQCGGWAQQGDCESNLRGVETKSFSAILDHSYTHWRRMLRPQPPWAASAAAVFPAGCSQRGASTSCSGGESLGRRPSSVPARSTRRRRRGSGASPPPTLFLFSLPARRSDRSSELLCCRSVCPYRGHNLTSGSRSRSDRPRAQPRSTSNCKINGHFSIENLRFSGAILH